MADWNKIWTYGGLVAGGIIAFLAMLFAGMAFAYTWGKDVGQAEVQRSRDDLDRANKVLATSQAELNGLKVQFASSRSGTPVSVQSNDIALPETNQKTANPFVPRISGPEDYRVTLRPGNSAELFDGKLTISLVGIDYDGQPLRNRADIIAISGRFSKKLSAADVGSQVQVGEYVITILAVSTFEASVRVKGNAEKASAG